MLLVKIIGVVAFVLWVICNLYVAITESAREMHDDFVKDQCLVGKVCTNIFYSLAWLLKIIRAIIA